MTDKKSALKKLSTAGTIKVTDSARKILDEHVAKGDQSFDDDYAPKKAAVAAVHRAYEGNGRIRLPKDRQSAESLQYGLRMLAYDTHDRSHESIDMHPAEKRALRAASKSIHDVADKLTAAFDESKHPRDDSGKFT